MPSAQSWDTTGACPEPNEGSTFFLSSYFYQVARVWATSSSLFIYGRYCASQYDDFLSSKRLIPIADVIAVVNVDIGIVYPVMSSMTALTQLTNRQPFGRVRPSGRDTCGRPRSVETGRQKAIFVLPAFPFSFCYFFLNFGCRPRPGGP